MAQELTEEQFLYIKRLVAEELDASDYVDEGIRSAFGRLGSSGPAKKSKTGGGLPGSVSASPAKGGPRARKAWWDPDDPKPEIFAPVRVAGPPSAADDGKKKGEAPPETEPETNGDGGGADLPVPVFKKFSGEEREVAGYGKSAAGSLSSQLQKLFPDVDKAIVSQILKDVAAQLKKNGVKIQEAKSFIFYRLLEEQLLAKVLVEKKPSRAKRKKSKAIMRQKQDSGKYSVQKLGAGSFTAQNAQGEKKEFHQLKYQNKYGAKALQKAKEEAECWAQTGEPCKDEDNSIFDKFKETLERLDLHTAAGREAAKEDEQAYLGAYRFYKAMKLAFKALEAGKLDQSAAKILKMVEPLNEQEDEGTEPGQNFRTWLGFMIKIFDDATLNDSARGMGAIKAARQSKMGATDSSKNTRQVLQALQKDPSPVKMQAAAKTLKDTYQSGKMTKDEFEGAMQQIKAMGAEAGRRGGAAGEINTRQSVGPRLKQGGIDLNSPEGKKLQKNMAKVIRRFINKNLQRIGQTNIKVIAESLIEKVLLEESRIDRWKVLSGVK